MGNYEKFYSNIQMNQRRVHSSGNNARILLFYMKMAKTNTDEYIQINSWGKVLRLLLNGGRERVASPFNMTQSVCYWLRKLFEFEFTKTSRDKNVFNFPKR